MNYIVLRPNQPAEIYRDDYNFTKACAVGFEPGTNIIAHAKDESLSKAKMIIRENGNNRFYPENEKVRRIFYAKRSV